jgi:hypothetical protein
MYINGSVSCLTLAIPDQLRIVPELVEEGSGQVDHAGVDQDTIDHDCQVTVSDWERTTLRWFGLGHG